jgi:lysophospholipase L1-like esterase
MAVDKPLRWALVAYLAALHVAVAALAAPHFFHASATAPPTGPVADQYGDVARSEQLAGAVAFVGDSRVRLFATSNAADRSENFGVSGEDLAGLAARLRTIDLTGARAIVLESGVDDWLTVHMANFRARYAAVLGSLPAKPLIAAAILPVNPGQAAHFYAGRFDFSGAEAAVSAANAEIARQCAARPACVFLPAPPALYAGAVLSPAISDDGVHLNAAGATIWAASIRQVVTHSGTRP